ncbi:MAG: hypothetical protein ACOY94_19775 [Bacillota bacterium]
MTYRRPRGLGAERGWHCAVAESKDGITFEDIWAVHKDQLGTSSMERFSIMKDDDRYLLYISYVDPADNRWRIDMLEASSPDQFNVAKLRRLFDGANTGTEGVKDPHVFKVGPLFYMLISFASVPKQATGKTTRSAAAWPSPTTCATGPGSPPTDPGWSPHMAPARSAMWMCYRWRRRPASTTSMSGPTARTNCG